ncbi:ketoacyl-ACP synthase III [Planktomarina temperata]|nr:ketoacyl-ACP synthase III [bacterium]MDB2459377.1 ketoacyl-ACP synthase III [Planktomarina temperata]
MRVSGVEVIGIASAVPSNIEKVYEIGAFSPAQAEKFSKVTGISERRLAQPGTFVSDLIFASVEKLLKDIPVLPSQIGALITITQTGDNAAPGVALKVASLLGCDQQMLAFDVNLGCSSFPYGLAIASSLMRTLNLEYTLLTIGDISSRICHPEDMATYPLFGDAGAAILLKRGEDNKGHMYFDLNSDGSGRHDIFIKSAGLSSEFPPLDLQLSEKNSAHMELKGANVFSFAIDKAPKSIKAVLTHANMEQPDVCVLHQANKKINDFIERSLSFSDCYFPSSLKYFGNTSSVTIPLTLVTNFGGSAMSANVLACGFGVGLSWGSVFTRFNKCHISELVEV